MNLPTLYRSLPHARQAKELVAEASSLSISALADLCEEHGIDSLYWRSCAVLLSHFENIITRGAIHLQQYELRQIHYTKRTITFDDIALPFPEHARISLLVRYNPSRLLLEIRTLNCTIGNVSRCFIPERLAFRGFGKARLQVARQAVEYLLAFQPFKPEQIQVKLADTLEPTLKQSTLFE